jgi:hypothetical protein
MSNAQTPKLGKASMSTREKSQPYRKLLDQTLEMETFHVCLLNFSWQLLRFELSTSLLGGSVSPEPVPPTRLFSKFLLRRKAERKRTF